MTADDYFWNKIMPWFVLAFIIMGLIGMYGHNEWCKNWEENGFARQPIECKK